MGRIISFLFLSAFLLITLHSGAHAEEKSSLAFAIDDTSSMRGDIEAVKKSALDIFETVKSSNSSQIEDFVLVTINDPVATHIITTSEREPFMEAINSLYAHNIDNPDCEEMSMAGMLLALENSKPESLLYVFTDAGPKDYQKLDAVIELAQAKSTPIVIAFAEDGCDRFSPFKGAFYGEIATKTGGQLFFMYKDEAKELLKLVKTQIDSRKPPVFQKTYPEGTHLVELDVDSFTEELIVSVSGKNPSVTVTDPDGTEATTEQISQSRHIAAVKVIELSPGKYKIQVDSKSENNVKISAATNLRFKHGFSTWKPKTINETVTRPIEGEESYLSVKLLCDDPEEFVLVKAQVLNLYNKVLGETQLELVDKLDHLYLGNTTIVPPSGVFKLMIQGYNIKTRELITRYSLANIAPQKKDKTRFIPSKAPIVTVIGDSEIRAEYDEPLALKCKVSAHPKPTVTWQSSNGTVMSPELFLQEYPYNYVSTLSIDRVVLKDTYRCIARNDHGAHEEQIKVITYRKIYFNVTAKPEDASIELYGEKQFKCKVDAYPVAVTNWFKDGKLVYENDNFKLSSDYSILTLKNMNPNMRGKYWCKSSNGIEKRIMRFKVKITGTEIPKIDKAVSEIPVKDIGEYVKIPCNLISGKPKPKIYWYFKDVNGIERVLDKYRNQQHYIIPSFNSENEGTYNCRAKNDLGVDFHRTDVVFTYPPTIDGNVQSRKSANVGDQVEMDCAVKGNPKPNVKWMLNNKEYVLNRRHFRDYRSSSSFSFYAEAEDSGVYTCQASNYLGTVNKTIELRVFRPATIDVPLKTRFTMIVGQYLELPCRVDGDPEPTVKWEFRSTVDPSRKQQELSFSNDELHKVKLGHVQEENEGSYTCIASNSGGAMSITYELEITSPPSIIKFPKRTFKAVVGDLVLRIPCKATGRPRPTINWVKNDYENIPRESEWYDIDNDGTLIIKNVDKESAGTYKCEVRNSYGVAYDYVGVEVEDFPSSVTSTKKIVTVMQGKSKALKCDIPHQPTDYFRWYKDGIQVSLSREHVISDARLTDAGIYTCRVSSTVKSTSDSVRVVVGVPLRFLEDEKENIEFQQGLTASMDCAARGKPMHKEVIWTHDGKQLAVKSMKFEFEMDPSSLGTYTCVVKNDYSSIQRNFTISSHECMLRVKTDLIGYQPLILKSDITWAELETNKGTLIIPPNENILLSCPNGFKNVPNTEVIASCNSNSFIVGGKDYTFADLQCRAKVRPIAQRTPEKCLKTNTNANIVRVGYTVRGIFLNVYEICLDTDTNTNLYTKHNIQNTLAGTEPNDFDWLKTVNPLNIDEAYSCASQVDTVYSVLGRWVHRNYNCCFSKRFLVNPKDVSPGLSQMATYDTANVVPQWSTCNNNENWDIIENRVRETVKSTNARLSVWSGTSGKLDISGHYINIRDEKGTEQIVPKYLWKVIQDPSKEASIAIVQLNIPSLQSVRQAQAHVFCKDICSEVSWLRDLVNGFRDFNKGYTFCCNTLDLERHLNYRDVFKSSGKVLYDVDVALGESLI